MIRMVQSRSASHAKAYFADALAKADYYLDGQELSGHVQGKLAERLGIAGAATKEVFFALAENRDPNTGLPLTPRTKEERTTGYDINFHCPKSVSILHALSKDDHLLKAFEQSIQETMRDIERDAKTRVRKGKQYDDRETGELVWADFTHQTARPTEGHTPDPHLHSHCFVFNATWDAEEAKIKAGQFRDIKRDMPYYQAAFHKRLSDNLIDLGYQVRRTDKSFEVEGVPQPVMDLFSKRTDEIGRVAKERGITGAQELSDLGARTRAKKQKGLSMSELKADWRRQIAELGPDINERGGEADRDIRFAPNRNEKKVLAEECVDYALRHGFERASVLEERKLLAAAIQHATGTKSVSAKEIEQAFKDDRRIIRVKDNGRMRCTTREVLAEEKRMVELARKGQGVMLPMHRKAPEISQDLDQHQHDAVEHVVTTLHRVSIIRGVAGAGKTTLLKEVNRLATESGKKIVALAPSASASRGSLRDAGFAEAETVAKLLVDKTMQAGLKDQVLLVDEAGMLGTRQTAQLLELATRQNAQVIFVGDTRQHASVDRGDALRILSTVAKIRTAEVSKIYRQQHAHYRQAVAELAEGDVRTAFERLDGLDFIKSVDPDSPNAQLVSDYMEAIEDKKSCLVISPTHAQGDAVTDEIRQRLRGIKQLGKKEIEAVRLQNRNLTQAQKEDVRNYAPGQVVQFNQHAPGFKRGSAWTVEKTDGANVHLVDKDGKTAVLPTDNVGRFDVFNKNSIALAKGDKVRVTRGGMDQSAKLTLNLNALKAKPNYTNTFYPDQKEKPLLGIDAGGKRLDNGDMLEVLSVNKKDGTMVLKSAGSKTRYHLDAGYGHLDHAYCTTSHAAQGKTVDEVFISQPAATFPATDAKQFYVSVSRGRERCRIYTDDKEELLEHAAEMSERKSALELTGYDATQDVAEQRQRERMYEPASDPVPDKSRDFDRRREPLEPTL